MEDEQIIEMVEEKAEELDDYDWWEGAFKVVEPYLEEFERADKTVFGWAHATAIARELAHGREPDADVVKFMATTFSLDQGYTPNPNQVRNEEFLRGWFEYVAIYGRDAWAEKAEELSRFHPFWQRIYRESNYYLSLEPRSVGRIYEMVAWGQPRERIMEELGRIAQREAKSWRSIAINLRYLAKVMESQYPTVAEVFRNLAREADRLHRRR